MSGNDVVNHDEQLTEAPEEFVDFSVMTETGREPDIDRLSIVARNTGSRVIVLSILEELGIAPTQETAEVDPEAAVLRKSVESRVDCTAAYYELVHWSDFGKREGRNIDANEALFNSTQPYDDIGLLNVFDRLYYRISMNSHFQDAEFIARLMVQRETEQA